MPDHHLRMPPADAMLFDSSDSEWHSDLTGDRNYKCLTLTPIAAVPLGQRDAPDFPLFNADPDSLPDRVENPERIQVLAPGSRSCCGECKLILDEALARLRRKGRSP